MTVIPADSITKTSTNSATSPSLEKIRSSLEPSPSKGCDLPRMQQLVGKLDRVHRNKPEAYIDLCERRVVALLLESQL